MDFKNLLVLVVSDIYGMADFKFMLENLGFDKSRIKFANDQKMALQIVNLISDTGENFDLIIFNYNDVCDLKVIEPLKDFEKNKSVSSIQMIALVHPNYKESLTRSLEFKNSLIHFKSSILEEISEWELGEIIRNVLKENKK